MQNGEASRSIIDGACPFFLLLSFRVPYIEPISLHGQVIFQYFSLKKSLVAVKHLYFMNAMKRKNLYSHAAQYSLL